MFYKKNISILILFAAGTTICFICSKIYFEFFYFRFINFWLDFCNNEIFFPCFFFFLGATMMQIILSLKDSTVSPRLRKTSRFCLAVILGVYTLHLVNVINTRVALNWIAVSPLFLIVVIIIGMVFSLAFG